jgi:uncharacterized Ntn-hydrolase superfamily protein
MKRSIEWIKANPILGIILILGSCFALTSLSVAGPFFYSALVQEKSTYSIVAMDPLTRDVGIAGASCVPISAASMTTLVPGMGAAATQAAYIPKNHAKMFELLKQDFTASEIIKQLSDHSYDVDGGIRQYGVVTMNEEIVQVAGFTGKDNNQWAGDRQNSTMAVSVQGNTLAGAAVVDNALAAFTEEAIGEVALSDRLLRALEAASAAGGDNRCNPGDFQQTALAAFIAVAKADQPPFAATLGRDPGQNAPTLPWLYISVIEAKGGPNPLLELRSQYDIWRSENLPPCAGCILDPIPVPPGGDPKPIFKAIFQFLSQIGLVGAAAGCLISVILLVSLPVLIYFRRQTRRSSV